MLLIEYLSEDGSTHIEPFAGMRRDAGGKFLINGTFVTEAMYNEVRGVLWLLASRTAGETGACHALKVRVV